MAIDPYTGQDDGQGNGGDWFVSNAPITTPTPDSIRALYMRVRGVQPTAQEIQAHLGNPGGLEAIEAALIAETPAGYVPPNAAQPPSQTNAPPFWTEEWFSSNIGRPMNNAELLALEGKITAAGGKILRNAAGHPGKIQDPSGQIVDIMLGSASGGHGFQWLTGAGHGGGVGLANIGNVDPFSYADFAPPAAFAEEFTFEDFVAPTQEEAMEDEGVQYELAAGQRALERSAAAKGTLLTGGTQRALTREQQGIARTGFNDIYGRKLSAYGANLNKALSAYGSRRDVNRDQYDRARDTWGANFGKNFSIFQDVMNNRFRLADLGRF